MFFADFFTLVFLKTRNELSEKNLTAHNCEILTRQPVPRRDQKVKFAFYSNTNGLDSVSDNICEDGQGTIQIK